MRKNDNDSRRSPRTPSGSKPRSSGAGKRDGKPRAGGGFESRSTSRGSEKSAGGYRGSRGSDSERSGGFGEARRSTDWSTGGYRITKKGAGKSSGGFKGYGAGRDAEQGTGEFRRPRRDSDDFRGPKRDSEQRTGGFRGQRRDDAPKTGGFRGPRRDDEPRTGGFRGQRRDDEPRTGGFRGQRRDDAPKPGGFRGPRIDDAPKTGGFRGPRKDDAPKAGGYRDSKRGFENKSPRTPMNKKFDTQRPKEDAYVKKETLRDNIGNELEEREDRVEGRKPVFEALRAGRPINKLFVEKDNEDTMISRIVAMAREKAVPIQYFDRHKLDAMSQTRIHQGVILEVAAQEYVEVEDILAKAAEKEEKPFILVLDGITDTNNLGSIIRSAECSGVHGIIIPKRRSATLNATVAKVAAGALEYVPVARVSNLVQTLRQLKEEGVWIVGADMDGESNYYDTDLKGPCALVIGGEGEGISRLAKDECDLMVKIPLKGKISSLNAGVAAALIMFEISKQRD